MTIPAVVATRVQCNDHCVMCTIRIGTAQNPSEVILDQIDWGRMVTHHGCTFQHDRVSQLGGIFVFNCQHFVQCNLLQYLVCMFEINILRQWTTGPPALRIWWSGLKSGGPENYILHFHLKCITEHVQ